MLPVIRKRTYLPRIADDIFGDNFLNAFFSDGADYMIPAVNIKENEKHYSIELAAPGLNKEDFNINIEKNVLKISSEKENKNESENENYTRKEFSYSSFSRAFSIPESVDVEKIKASHKNGVLSIELPKHEESKLKKTVKIS
jgi:HSP20 family protein